MRASVTDWELRPSTARGQLELAWLHARFSFSFGGWDDPRWRRFGPVLALNEDRVQPGTGFPMHPHRDLEILLLPLAGVVEHRDDLGHHGWVRPGELQFLRAGRGIRHTQMNTGKAVDHHLQVWLAPRRPGLSPAALQAPLPPPGADGWQVLAGGATAPAPVDADVVVALADARRTAGPRVTVARQGRWHYVHVVDGRWQVTLRGASRRLGAGDALVLRDDTITAVWQPLDEARGRLLAFDVARQDVLAAASSP